MGAESINVPLPSNPTFASYMDVNTDQKQHHTVASQGRSQDGSYRKLVLIYCISQMRVSWEILVQFNHHRGDLYKIY